MWLAKIKYHHDDCVTLSKVVKHQVTAYAVPGNSFSDSKFIYSTGFLMLVGEEKNKRNFIRDLKKDKKVLKVEVNHDLIMFVEKNPLDHPEYAVFRSPEIMTTKPVYCNPEDGFEYWNVCAWDKKHLQKFLVDIKKIGEAHLISIQKMKLQDLYQFHLSPRLTSKQKQALDLAMKFGYYDLPRKTDIVELGKRMKISHQAFSEHLRKAEAKLLPMLAESFVK
ncbi:MAG: helix-turn-helix domain-containing protein [Candidatus Woesearchaeota archaeon]|jgi:predicted DNA binding protein